MNNGELSWNDELDPNASNFELLPEGAYDFVVTEMKKERFSGSKKMGACDQATLTVRVEANGMKANITHRLYLHTKCAGLLVGFFRSIGATANEAGRIRMDWNIVVGGRGRCLVEVHRYMKETGPDTGQEYISNQIKRFLTPEEAAKVELATKKGPWSFRPQAATVEPDDEIPF